MLSKSSYTLKRLQSPEFVVHNRKTNSVMLVCQHLHLSTLPLAGFYPLIHLCARNLRAGFSNAPQRHRIDRILHSTNRQKRKLHGTIIVFTSPLDARLYDFSILVVADVGRSVDYGHVGTLFLFKLVI